MMGTTEKIIEAYEGRGLCTGFIYGKFAHGKTSYLLHVAQEVFEALFNLTEVEAWVMALDHLFFNPIYAMAYIEAFKSKQPNDRVVLLGMDDVGQHLPRAHWWREDVVQFREWNTVARSDVAGIFYTAPTQLSLPSGIIDCCFLRFNVKKDHEVSGQSIALAYEVSVTPWFQKIVAGPKWRDEFPTHYPKFVYDEYEAMRKDMVAPLRKHLIELLGFDNAIKELKKLGARQASIAKVLGVSQPTVSRHLEQ